MSNIIEVIGVAQIELLDKYIYLRRKKHKFYTELFNNIYSVALHTETNPDYFSNHWLSCIVIDEKFFEFSRDDLRVYLSKEGIDSRPLWKPIHFIDRL